MWVDHENFSLGKVCICFCQPPPPTLFSNLENQFYVNFIIREFLDNSDSVVVLKVWSRDSWGSWSSDYFHNNTEMLCALFALEVQE